jgi:transcription elongation factor GreB
MSSQFDGATVLVRPGSAEEEAYRIVGVDEADPERGWISWISPLARARLSRRAGEKVASDHLPEMRNLQS